KMAEGGSPDCEAQKNEIAKEIKATLKKGDIWYLIDTKWFKQWKKYVGYDSWDTSYVGEKSAFPGPIDNSPLFDGEKGGLREHLLDDLDYQLIAEPGWQKLVKWYGVTDEEESVSRKVIEQGMFVKQCKVEVYLLDLKLCQNSNTEEQVSRQFSRADTLEYIEQEMRKLFEIKEDTEVRLWNKYMTNTYEHLNKPDNTVQDAGLYPGQVIVIEQKNEDGTWPRQNKAKTGYGAPSSPSPSTLSITSGSDSPASSSYNGTVGASTSTRPYSSGYSSGGSSYSYGNSYDTGRGGSAAPGLCGLSNLGNTCFMNSALQVMSNVPDLTEYMLSDKWEEELNYDNPLGMKGEIAKSYAELIKTIWSGKYSYTVPRNFKLAVGRFAPQFSGFQQQDSQELMAFLLDGLHEDLNRILKKPYIEQKDAEGKKDKEVANEAWENYRKRNDSIIVDTLHGLLKSTLVCPDCSKVSVTFDPFCYLSLPLPVKKERQIEVFYIPLDPMKKTVQYKLTVPKMGSVKELCQALSKVTDTPSDKLVVTDVYNHRFHKVFQPDEGITHILDRDDIFVYEVPVSTGDDPETLILPVYLREKTSRASGSGFSNYSSTQLFGQPLLVPVPRKNCTYDALYNAVLNRMSRYVTVPTEDDAWWEEFKAQQEDAMSEEDANEYDTTDSTENTETNSINNKNQDIINENDTNKSPAPCRLFSFTLVNSYGSAEVEQIKDNGKPIKLSGRSYVAIDWYSQAKKKYFNEKLADDLLVDDSMNMKQQQRRQVIQLTDCLDLFTTTEKLGEQDPWYCPRCKKHQQATKKFDLWKLPKVLVIHLKRFNYNRYWRDKIDALVEFPVRGLQMKNLLINKDHGPALYDLIGVVNHYGGMGGGHYTAYGLNSNDKQWHHFDDSSVSSVDEDGVVTRAAYVLVYHLRVPGAAEPPRDIPAALGAAPQSSDSNYSNGSNGLSTTSTSTSDDEMDTN
ncbi:unnamed protein product, partial [Owenia fusiformis]